MKIITKTDARTHILQLDDDELLLVYAALCEDNRNFRRGDEKIDNYELWNGIDDAVDSCGLKRLEVVS